MSFETVVFVVSDLIQAIEAFIRTVMSFETVVFVVAYLIQVIEAFICTVMSFETVVFVMSYLIQVIERLYAQSCHLRLLCLWCHISFRRLKRL